MDYKEKLRLAKEALESGSYDRETIEYIFPELKESEDERIRGAIIEHLKDNDLTEWAAWLENQGDINRRIQEEIEKQTKQQWKSKKQGVNVSGECNDTALEEQLKIWFEKGKCSGIDDVIFHPQKYGLEKQGEQKQDPCEKCDHFTLNCHNFPCIEKKTFDQGKSTLEAIKEEKVAWSEEDETALGDALWCCKQAASIAKDENDMGNIWYAERWLKSIKERMKGE